MSMVHRVRRASSIAAASAACVAMLAATGCGEEDDGYANKPRPPSPIVVSASIGDGRVSVSPRTFGAGPITLLVTNQTSRAQDLTLETDEIGGDAPGIEQSSGPINPGDTASLQADLRRGTYRIGVDAGGIEGASLRVGDERPSAQDELLQP
jgi:hypothetical protein